MSNEENDLTNISVISRDNNLNVKISVKSMILCSKNAISFGFFFSKKRSFGPDHKRWVTYKVTRTFLRKMIYDIEHTWYNILALWGNLHPLRQENDKRGTYMYYQSCFHDMFLEVD